MGFSIPIIPNKSFEPLRPQLTDPFDPFENTLGAKPREDLWLRDVPKVDKKRREEAAAAAAEAERVKTMSHPGRSFAAGGISPGQAANALMLSPFGMQRSRG